MKTGKNLLRILGIVLLLMIATEGVTADSEIFNDTIERGNGYQINNYVIDVADVFTEAGSEGASIYIYRKNEEIDDTFLSVNGTFSFDFEDEGEVTVKLIKTAGSALPRAQLSIVLSDYSIQDLHTNKVISGGHDEATFAGTPVLDINKNLDSDTIKSGETVKVTVKAQNTGDDKATDVIFSDPMQENFVLEETFVDQMGPMSIEVDETKTIAVYLLKATESGNFTLKPTTATFSNTAGQDFSQATSNTPSITVKAAEKEKAVLNLTNQANSLTVPRGETVTSTINIKNTGKAPAKTVQVNFDIPDGMEYVEGDNEIEIIDSVPQIYLESLGEGQEKEISFSVKANEMGTYNLSAQLSYNNGADESINIEATTNNIHVKEGRFDFLLNQPIYVYVLPFLVIIGVGGWVYYKHREYKF
jgi:uncharacterized repeat protein (TIGR01451 family)